MDSLGQFRAKYQNIPLEDRSKFLKELSPSQINFLYENPRIFLSDYQIPPETNWRYHWLCAGRGTGKTFASTSWLYEKIINGAQEVAIIAATYPDLVKDVKPVFEKHFPPDKQPRWYDKGSVYSCYNGCVVKVYTSDMEIRGFNAEYGIAEEMCKWNSANPEKVAETFAVMEAGVRNRRATPPQIFISTTPKPFQFFLDFQQRFLAGDPDYSMVIAKSKDNKFVSQDALRSLYKNMSERQRRQELDAELLTDNPNALWSRQLIESCHVDKLVFEQLISNNQLKILKVVIAVDVAVSTNPNSDETGIIIAALCSDNKVYILEDLSGKHIPSDWESIVVNKYKEYNAAFIVMEKNQGGNLLEAGIKSLDRYARTKLITATVSKQTRFEPIVAAYERGEVRHVGNLSELERQMLSYNPYTLHGKSPDRADAMAYAVYELLINQLPPQYRSTRNYGKW